jgi:four helix bundle protein
MDTKIINFTDLKAWRVGHQIVLEIYALSKTFPREELFGLVSQIRRAAVSITSNLAEGFSRSTAKDKAHFYAITLGSLTEVQNQILIAKDLGYIPEELTNSVLEKIMETIRMTNGLIKSANNRS